MLTLEIEGPHARIRQCSPKKLAAQGGPELTASNRLTAQFFGFREPGSANMLNALGRRFFPELLNKSPGLFQLCEPLGQRNQPSQTQLLTNGTVR